MGDRDRRVLGTVLDDEVLVCIDGNMDDEYAEYKCTACKKAIKSQVVTCKSCSSFTRDV